MIHKCFWLYSRGPEFGCFSFWKRQNDTLMISHQPTCRWESLCPASWSYEAKEAWWSNFVTWGLNGFNQWLNQPSSKLEGDVRPFSAPKRKWKQPGSRGAMGQGGNCGVWLWGDKIQMIKQLGLGRLNRDIHKCRLSLGFSYDWEKYISKNLLATVEQGRCKSSGKTLSKDKW